MSPPGGFAQSRSPELHPEKLARTWPRSLARRRVTLTTGIAREIRKGGSKEDTADQIAGTGGMDARSRPSGPEARLVVR